MVVELFRNIYYIQSLIQVRKFRRRNGKDIRRLALFLCTLSQPRVCLLLLLCYLEFSFLSISIPIISLRTLPQKHKRLLQSPQFSSFSICFLLISSIITPIQQIVEQKIKIVEVIRYFQTIHYNGVTTDDQTTSPNFMRHLTPHQVSSSYPSKILA